MDDAPQPPPGGSDSTAENAPDDDTENCPPTGDDQPTWRYVQERKRGANRTYFGHVEYIHGAAGEHRRDELAKVIRDLLAWAAEQSEHPGTTDDDAT